MRKEQLVARKSLRDVGEIEVRTEIDEVPGRLEVDAYREEVLIERRCEKCSRVLSEAGEHDADHGQADKRLTAGGQDLVIFAQPTGQVQPADGPLDDPPPLEQHEARAAGWARHDLQHPLGGAACPADQATAVSAVSPDPSQARHPPEVLLQQQATTGAILDAGRVDQQSVHQAESVHQQVALATFDQLAAIKAAFEPAALDRLDGLAVQDGGGWVRIGLARTNGIRQSNEDTRGACARAAVRSVARSDVA